MLINPSRSSIEQLKQWQRATTDNRGIIMPCGLVDQGGQSITVEQIIHNKLLVATTLYPQISAGEIQYLFGKGIGCEIAMQATPLQSETKTDYNFEARSHSDFELYGVADMDNPYTSGFREVFGAQEIYPVNKTKCLHEIEGMHQLAQSYEWNNLELITPEIELMFLEKLILKESQILRTNDRYYDYELLAQRYELDFDKINSYLDRYYIEPNQKNGKYKSRDTIEKRLNRSYQQYINFGNTPEVSLQNTRFQFKIPNHLETVEDMINYLYASQTNHIEIIKSEIEKIKATPIPSKES